MARRSILLLGMQGAGKGTVGSFLAHELGATHLSAGTLLRQRTRADDRVAEEVRLWIDRGLAVPEEISYGLLEKELEAVGEGATLVLDGYPHEISQVGRLRDALGAEPEVALMLRVPLPMAVERLSKRETCETCDATFGPGAPAPSSGECGACGGRLSHRADDSPFVMARRHDGWEGRSSELLAHFERMGSLTEIDASGKPVEVAERAMKVIGGLRN